MRRLKQALLEIDLNQNVYFVKIIEIDTEMITQIYLTIVNRITPIINIVCIANDLLNQLKWDNLKI